MTGLPQLKAEELKLRRSYHVLFSQPDAKPILDDLARRFGQSSLHKTFNIDDFPTRFAFSAGAREVLLHIDTMMRERDAAA